MKNKYADVIKEITKLVEKNKEKLEEIEELDPYRIFHIFQNIFSNEIPKMKRSVIKKIISSGISKNISVYTYRLNKERKLFQYLFKPVKIELGYKNHSYGRITYSFSESKTIKSFKKITKKEDFHCFIRVFSNSLNECCKKYRKLSLFCLKNANGLFLKQIVRSNFYNGKDIQKEYKRILNSSNYSSDEKIGILDFISKKEIVSYYNSYKKNSIKFNKKLKKMYTIELISNLDNYKNQILDQDGLIFKKDFFVTRDDYWILYNEIKKKIPEFLSSLSRKEIVSIIDYSISLSLNESLFRWGQYGVAPIVSSILRIIVIDACKYLDVDEDCLYLMHHVNSNGNHMSASLQNKIDILLSKEKCIWS